MKSPQTKAHQNGEASQLQQLRRQFEIFRNKTDHVARIPESLQAAVVAAHQRGISATAIRNATGVTYRQLQNYEAKAANQGWSEKEVNQAVRVLNVVDTEEDLGTHSYGANQTLSLNLGPWRIEVQHNGLGLVRGEVCCR